MFSAYPIELSLHLASALLSSMAAVMALYLVQLSGRIRAWLLLSVTFLLFFVERVGELLAHAGILLDARTQDIASDILLFASAACLLGGVFYIRDIFHVHNGERHKLMQRLDELQRFHQVTIGRELRMKELCEENQVLKARIGEAGK